LVRILVLGAGVSGCAAAFTLASGGYEVVLIEKTDRIGGRVRTYGCKAVDRCQNCGVCLTVGLWDKVSTHPNIQVMTNIEVLDILDLKGKPGRYSVNVVSDQSEQTINDINAIIVSTGFDSRSDVFPAHLHIDTTDGLMTGSTLEELLLKRTRTGLFEHAPESVAFIQCLGSRDKNDGGLYCSRVCCSYSTRAAKLIRSYYPDCKIVFYYMELQNVESGDFYAGLQELGIEFIKCRPSEITDSFDLVVLSDGIHAGVDNDRIAEVCRLGIDKDGFLRSVGEGSCIYVCGCARAPMKIDEAYADAVAVANKILSK